MQRNKGEGSLYWEKRNGKKYWRAIVTLGYDENGKQIRKTASGYDKSKVIKKMQELEATRSETSLNLDFKGNVQDLFKSWMFMIKKPHIQPLSFSKYEETHRIRLKDTELGKTDIQEVTSILVQKFFNELRLKYSEEVTKRTRIHLNAFFEYMVDEFVLSRNPCKNIKIKTEIKENTNYKVYTRIDQEKIINGLDLEDPVEMMIYLAFATGLRLGELTALTWNDYRDEQIYVNKQYSRNAITYLDGTKDRTSEVRTLKTNSSYRVVPLPETAINKLNKYKLKQLEIKMLNIEEYEKNNLMFPNETGTYQNLNRPTRRMKTICKKIGVEYISFHAIRHSYVTRLFEEGVHFKKIQNLAGHSSPQTTLNIYTHTNKEMLKEAVENINEIL